jgi:thioesterase domain-containing protein
VPGNLPHDPDTTDGPADLATSLVEIAQLVSRISLREVPLTLEELRPLDPESQLQAMLDKLKAINFFPPETGLKPMRGLLRVHHAGSQASWEYVEHVQPLAQPLTLFVAETIAAGDFRSTPRDLAADPTLGWGTLVECPIERYIVPGDHISMLTRPHVEVLATQLRRCLAALHPQAPSREVPV